ncbi:DUF6851 domain-containing protein [Meridianimarinicoccus aquatilis]|uniref:Calcium-binding protein n=1 Tax=Meridianimarinicoccus aquatilis TaxID=2552766 RepID=A0A4R6B2U5_9RHOB|nr:calcium-binding protein [Fluviibacterium aquatile]TDL90484.1 calcium-binding protein [Fluviibacterium aquatile]
MGRGTYLTSVSSWLSHRNVSDRYYVGTNRDDNVILSAQARAAFLLNGDDTLLASAYIPRIVAGNGNDHITLENGGAIVDLGNGNDVLVSDGPVGLLTAGNGNDAVTLADGGEKIDLGKGSDALTADGHVTVLKAGKGNDTVALSDGAGHVDLGHGNDTLVADGYVDTVDAGNGKDEITLTAGGGMIDLGRGNDTLTVGPEAATFADGGRGKDALVFTDDIGQFDIALSGDEIVFIGRFSGEEFTAKNFETFTFNDADLSLEELRAAYDEDALPVISVGGGTQTVTVNDVSPTVSVIWDRTVQQMIIENTGPNGPTIASRAYAMVHTAIYDAWSSYDDTAVRVSFDLEGDNTALEAGAVSSDANKEKAMSYAAFTVLSHLLPGHDALLETVMQDRLGFDLTDDGSIEAAIGIDAAEDLLALRIDDGSNEAGGYTGTFTPTNPDPSQINDITAWTPESVPIDPEGVAPYQEFLTPQWGDVESFALLEDADGETDFSDTLPVPPKAFFTDEYAASVLNFDAATITLSADFELDGVIYLAGETIDVSKALIGSVINQGFIDQAMEIVNISANLTDEEKIIAEFWEDAGQTAFPPGTFMTFAQFVSARDDHSIDQDAAMFLAMGNAVLDAGIATWEAKVEYDYVRPVRAIRDLGELGLIGEMGVDEITGETGYVIQAWGGVDETGAGRGTMTILAENFVTFQRPNADASPPFAEYTSGHSGFSSAGAEVLLRFTGSDEFGGSVTFEPGSTQFELGVPLVETTLSWDTFTEAADEAGMSRLYGNIHFTDGDLYGRDLGRQVGADAYDLAQMFVDGTAVDSDRPFYTDDFLFMV